MTLASWGQQAPPMPDDPPRASWQWSLISPLDLTTSRMEMRSALEQRSDQLPDCAEPEDVDRLLLAYEELASNGLRHGTPPVLVEVTGTAGGWLIDVTDAATDDPPTPAVGRDPADGGLGLYLTAALATACGWVTAGNRKHVWACIRPIRFHD